MVEDAVEDALFGAIAELGFTTYTVLPQATDGGGEAAFPHVHISTIVFAPWDSFAAIGHDFAVRIHTRWRGGSKKPGNAIRAAVYDRLHRTTDLSVAGFQLILLDREASSVTRLSDGSFDGICEYRGLLTPT